MGGAEHSDSESRETILVVEDNESVRMTVLMMLKTLKYRVVEAENGKQALAILQKDEPIDLLFTDIVMPGEMSGPDLAAQARTLRPDLKVLYTSGFSEAAALKGYTQPIQDPILPKPYRRNDLSQKIREVMGGA